MDVWETILVARATGIHISFISTLFVEAILSAVRLGMFFFPGGIGVKEIGYFAFFSSFHFPVSAVQIGAFVVIKRIVSIFCITQSTITDLVDEVRICQMLTSEAD